MAGEINSILQAQIDPNGSSLDLGQQEVRPQRFAATETDDKEPLVEESDTPVTWKGRQLPSS